MDGWTDQRTDGWTKPLIELRVRNLEVTVQLVNTSFVIAFIMVPPTVQEILHKINASGFKSAVNFCFVLSIHELETNMSSSTGQ